MTTNDWTNFLSCYTDGIAGTRLSLSVRTRLYHSVSFIDLGLWLTEREEHTNQALLILIYRGAMLYIGLYLHFIIGVMGFLRVVRLYIIVDGGSNFVCIFS